MLDVVGVPSETHGGFQMFDAFLLLSAIEKHVVELCFGVIRMEHEARAEQFRRFLSFPLLGIDKTVSPDRLWTRNNDILTKN